MLNPYTTLNVARDATPEQIKRAWRSLAADAHPDRVGGDASRMSDINVAYEILSDPVARERFDLTGEVKARTSEEQKARDLIFAFCELLVKSMNDEVDLIASLNAAVEAHRQGIIAARENHRLQIQALIKRRAKIRGPEDNFLFWWFDARISALSANLERMEADEAAALKALELLKDFSWESRDGFQAPAGFFQIFSAPSTAA